MNTDFRIRVSRTHALLGLMLICLAVCLAPSPARAQTTFIFTGTTTDSQGTLAVPVGTPVTGTFTVNPALYDPGISIEPVNGLNWAANLNLGTSFGSVPPTSLSGVNFYLSVVVNGTTYTPVFTGPAVVESYLDGQVANSLPHYIGTLMNCVDTGCTDNTTASLVLVGTTVPPPAVPPALWDASGLLIPAAVMPTDAASGEPSQGGISQVIGGVLSSMTFQITSVVQLAALTVTADVTGVQVNNPGCSSTPCTYGWYITNPTTLTWVITGNPTPTLSGCATVRVPNTAGTTYTCTATNTNGSATGSVTIKKDAVLPRVTSITSPKDGGVYLINSSVPANFACADAGLSGLWDCTASVVYTTVPGYPSICGSSQAASCDIAGLSSGTPVDTLTPGPHYLAVYATNYAGNQVSKAITYTVELQASAPVFSLAPGTYHGAQSVTITEATSGAVVYYTTDGTKPTAASAQYTGAAIPISTTERLKAIAIAPGNFSSTVTTAAYVIR